MRRFWPTVLAAGLLACGCGEDARLEGGGLVSGSVLTVSSLLSDPQSPVNRDIVLAEKLALLEAGGRAGKFTVNFSSFDDGAASQRVSDAARDALYDTQLVATIGDFDSQTVAEMQPILNGGGVVLISLGAGYRGFNESVKKGEPDRYSPSGLRTFVNLTADDRAEAKALLESSDADRLSIDVEPDPDSRNLASEVRREANRSGIKVVPRGGDARIFIGSSAKAAAKAANRSAETQPNERLLFCDRLGRFGVERELSPRAASRARIISRAPLPGSTKQLRAFEERFASRFGHRPNRYAILGYEAMQSVLTAIERAGRDANKRSAFVRSYFSRLPSHERFSVLSPRARS